MAETIEVREPVRVTETELEDIVGGHVTAAAACGCHGGCSA